MPPRKQARATRGVPPLGRLFAPTPSPLPLPKQPIAILFGCFVRYKTCIAHRDNPDRIRRVLARRRVVPDELLPLVAAAQERRAGRGGRLWRSPPSGIAPQYRGTVPGLTTVSPTHKQPAHRRIPRSSAEPDELLPLVSAA